MECPSCNEPMERMGLGANPDGGRVASIYSCLACGKCFRPIQNPGVRQNELKEPGKLTRGMQKIATSTPVLKAKETVKKAYGPAGAIAGAAAKSAAVTGLRTAAGMVDGSISTPKTGSTPGPSKYQFKSYDGHDYNIGAGEHSMPEKGMYIKAHTDENGNEVAGKWLKPGDDDYIDPPGDFWPTTPAGDAGGGGNLMSLLGGLKGLSPENLMKVVPQVAIIQGAVDVLKGPGGQGLLSSVGAGVGTGVGELLGKEGLGRLVGTGATDLVGSVGQVLRDPGEINKEAIKGSFGVASQGLGGITGLIGQNQLLEHQRKMAEMGYAPPGAQSFSAVSKNPKNNPKEETPEQWLVRMATTQSSNKEDAQKMQNLLHRLGYKNATVIAGVTSLTGEGAPASIHSIALLILNQIGLEKQKAGGGPK